MRCRSVSLSCKGKINHLIRLPQPLLAHFWQCADAVGILGGHSAFTATDQRQHIRRPRFTADFDAGTWPPAWTTRHGNGAAEHEHSADA